MSEWSASIEAYSLECTQLEETYAAKFAELYHQRNRLRRQKQRHMISYVVDNTYFHDTRVQSVVPEVERFMTENFNPSGTSVPTMFNLNALTLQEDVYGATPAFTFGFDEEEVVQWFSEMDQ